MKNYRFIQLALAVLLFTISQTVCAQVTIGSARPPAPYALLELDASIIQGGLRLPQLNAERATEIKASVEAVLRSRNEEEILRTEGLTFFNTSTECIEVWNGHDWYVLCNGEDMADLLNTIEIIRDSLLLLNTQIREFERDMRVTEITQYVGRTTFPNHPDIGVRRGLAPAGSAATGLTGLGVSMANGGFAYTFWGTGQLSGGVSMAAGRHYLLVSGEVDDLANGICSALMYSRYPISGTAWLFNTQGGGSFIQAPIFFDNTGIYIMLTNSQNLAAGSVIHFSQTIFLNPPQ